MFNSYFDEELQKAQPIEKLIEKFKKEGTWPADEKAQSDLLMQYRIAFLGETMVNWCPKLGTVLANDEVVEGVSVRGGYPVEQKKMRQWCLRVSAYSQRLLDGLDTIDWSESIKETQRNWIGRSEGHPQGTIKAKPIPFSTSFMVLEATRKPGSHLAERLR